MTTDRLNTNKLDIEILEIYKPKIEEIIEYVKVNKKISLPEISDKYSFIGITIIQNYLREKCLKLGWRIEKLNSSNNNNYCVINIYSL